MLFVKLTPIMRGIKGVKHSAKTVSSDSKSEDLHDDPIYIVRTSNKIYDSFKERMEILPRNQVFELFRHRIQRAGIKYTILLKSDKQRIIRKSLTLVSKQPPRIATLKIKHPTKHLRKCIFPQ